MLERLVACGGHGVRVRRLGRNRAGEIRITRFLRNRAVSVDEMMGAARARLAEAVAGRHVLAIRDTTVARSAGGGGSYLHAMIAVDAGSGALLGAIDAGFLHRTQGLRASRGRRSFAEKESARGLAAAQMAARATAGAERVTVIADREADVFELFAQRPAGIDLLIRAAHDRVLNDGGRLFSRAGKWPRAGTAELDLPTIPGRPARQARLAVRFGQVSVKPPQNGSGRGPASVPVTLVELREETPPAGAKPLLWRLLTNPQGRDRGRRAGHRRAVPPALGHRGDVPPDETQRV